MSFSLKKTKDRKTLNQKTVLSTNKIGVLSILAAFTFTVASCAQKRKQQSSKNNQVNMQNTAVATFGAGCFWCVEAVYQRLDGVLKVESGYEGGQTKNPTYKEICTGLTGHAEVCRITYDPTKLKFEELLEVFWKTHDPTTLNRQGNDVGTQYRSVVYYHSGEQKQLAEEYKKKLDESGAFSGKIVTEISPTETFYVAEDYHQNYFNENGYQPYCQFVVKPKVEKFEKVFKDRMKQ